MIVYFNFTEEELVKSDISIISYKVSEIIKAHNNGKILAFFDRESIDWIIENADLSNIDKSILRKIDQVSTQYRSILISAPVKIKIVSNNLKKDTECCGSDLIFSIKDDFSNSLEMPYLIVEDIVNDGNIITKNNKYFQKNKNIPNISYDLLHGGGERIIEIAAEKISFGRNIIGICDLDKKAPISNDYKENKIKRLVKSNNCIIKILPCLEMENVIGHKLFNEFKNNSFYDTVLFIDSVDENIDSNSKKYGLFFDLKKGFTKEIYNSITDEKEIQWINENVGRVINLEKDFCYLGFGDRILSLFINDDEFLFKLSRQMKNTNWIEVFDDFFSYVLFFLISNPRSLTYY